jgi:hypothetical protein
MINAGLTWFLGSIGVRTELQSGFRKGQRTTDQLVRLESFINEAFVLGKKADAVYSDIEKGLCDTTWKHET